jgi:6,7-dimethyl-8-ribityllumazine synthase
MPRVFEGALCAGDLRFGIVASRFNEFIVHYLVRGALQCLGTYGADTGRVDVVWVPGAFEIPTAAARLAKSGRYDAVICLGAVIQGETSHFDHVAGEVTRGVGAVGRETGVPTMFGVQTTETLEQAVARSNDGEGNKGWEAALAAIEMVSALALWQSGSA